MPRELPAETRHCPSTIAPHWEPEAPILKTEEGTLITQDRWTIMSAFLRLQPGAR